MRLNQGRDLDALIAEKVMGAFTFPIVWMNEPIGGGPKLDRIVKDVKNYSTDIAAAWEVVEKIRLTNDFQIESRSWGKPATDYWIKIGDLDCGNANTAPHAICLAALKAIGYEASG